MPETMMLGCSVILSSTVEAPAVNMAAYLIWVHGRLQLKASSGEPDARVETSSLDLPAGGWEDAFNPASFRLHSLKFKARRGLNAPS